MAGFVWFGKINKAVGCWVAALQAANPKSISTTSSLPPTIIGSGQRYSACKAKPTKQPKRITTGSRFLIVDQHGLGINKGWGQTAKFPADGDLCAVWVVTGRRPVSFERLGC